MRALKKTKLGFTLIEIVVAIAILVTLGAVFIPTLITYVEKSRISSDLKMCGEVANSIKIASGQIGVFDELTHYAVSNNFLTYSDSSGEYGSQEKDSEYWAPDGSGLATTITFNPIKEGGKSYYDISKGYVNDVTYGNGSTIFPARVIDDCDAYSAQCMLTQMMAEDEAVTAYTYNAILADLGNRIPIKSATYANSSMTMFIKFGYTADGNMALESITGCFNGTNLDADSLASVGTGTTEIVTTPEGEKRPNGTQSGTTRPSVDFSGLTGGGESSHRPYEEEKEATFSKTKFHEFCQSLPDKEAITMIEVVAGGAGTNAIDVTNEGNEKIVAWQEGNKLLISASVGGRKIALPADASHLFDTDLTGLYRVKKILAYNFVSTNVTNAAAMFKGNNELTYIDIKSHTFGNTANMSYFFSGCTNLRTIIYTNWDTSKLNDASYMFEGCESLAKYPTAGWNTTNLTNAEGMFKGCNKTQKIDVSNINTTNVMNFSHMFEGCTGLRELNLATFKVDKATNLSAMFKDCSRLSKLSLDGWNVKSATDLSEMFANCKSLKVFEDAVFTNTGICTDFHKMFYGCEKIKELNLSNFDTSKASDLVEMFDGMLRLEKVILGDKFTFAGDGSSRCYLPTPSSVYIQGTSGVWIDENGKLFRPRQVPSYLAMTYTAIGEVNKPELAEASVWWRGTTYKDTIEKIIITNSYKGTTFDESFNADKDDAGDLKVYIEGTTAYLVNTANRFPTEAFYAPQDSTGLFGGFASLKSIDGTKLIDFTNTNDMTAMFIMCKNLKTINGLNTWNVQNVTSMQCMFAGCGMKILDLSMWQTNNLRVTSQMFKDSNIENLNLSGWDTSQLSTMREMFGTCAIQTLDLRGWTSNNGMNTENMFKGSADLTTIYASKNFNLSKTEESNPFLGCISILGGNGSAFTSASVAMAKIDEAGSPGYFTLDEKVGNLNAILYSSGSAGLGVRLTEDGATAIPWDYRNGSRMLEINVSALPTNRTKRLEISVPVGMSIINNSWTQKTTDILDVKFIKNANQGTGKYVNDQSGTLTYTLAPFTKSATITLQVMFDTTLWDKLATTATNKNGYTITKDVESIIPDDAIVVILDNTITKKISKITASKGIAGQADGWGYNWSIWQQNNYQYIVNSESEKKGSACNGNYLDSIDRSDQMHYYKSVDYETYLYSTDASGKRIYAIPDEQNPKQFNSTTTVTRVLKVPSDTSAPADAPARAYTAHWDNPYDNQLRYFPNINWTLLNSDGFVDGKTATQVYVLKLVTYSGREIKLTRTQNYTIKSTGQDYSMFAAYGYTRTVLSEDYFANSDAMTVLGTYHAYGKCISDLDNIHVKAVFDSTNTGAPNLKVVTFNAPCDVNEETDYDITLINDAGQKFGPYTVKLRSRSQSNQGTYINATTIANQNGLSGKYYLKEVEYTIPKVYGQMHNRYLGVSGGHLGQNGGGTFSGWATGQAQSTITFSFPDGTTPKTATTTTKVQTASQLAAHKTSFSGYINSITTPKMNVLAGEDFELDVNVYAHYYSAQYSDNVAAANWFKHPVLYVVIPIGVDIEGVIIGNSATTMASEAKPVVTKVKSVEVDGVLSNIYKIAFETEVPFGYFALNSGNTSTMPKNTSNKWIRLMFSTDSSMPTSVINLKNSVYFTDDYGFMANQSNFGGAHIVTDIYDVDNNSGTPAFASIASTKYITINADE